MRSPDTEWFSRHPRTVSRSAKENACGKKPVEDKMILPLRSIRKAGTPVVSEKDSMILASELSVSNIRNLPSSVDDHNQFIIKLNKKISTDVFNLSIILGSIAGKQGFI